MSRRVSLHDRDAAGITDAAAAKTAGVVDTLIAPDVAAGDDRIVHIPVGKIVPHPRNRKILDEDVADLVASFKAGEPILNAIGVTAAADWNTGKPDDLKPIQSDEFIITAGGHRRLRAAELAGLKTAPCIVRATFAGAEGRRAALLENLHRQDLDVFEEAAAFAELVAEPYKMSQRELSTVVFGKVNQQSHISKRLKLLKLPTTVREKVRLGKMTIADALALAGVVDNQPVFDLAMTKVDQWHYDAERAVRLAQQEHDALVVREKRVAELTAAGTPLLKAGQQPQWYPRGRGVPTRLEGLKLSVDKHTTEPCHAAYLDHGGNVILVCATPGNHLKAGGSKLKVSKTVEADVVGRGGSGDEAAVRRERNDLKKLWPGRAAIARQIVHRQVELDAAVERELIAIGSVGLAFHGQGSADTWKVVRDFAMPVEPLGDYPTEDATADLLHRLPREATARVMALAYFECRIRSHYKTWGSDGRFYLDLLVQYGYTLNHLETKKLGPAKQPATARCAVCNAAESDFPPGVTWLEPNLCSGCGDARENGWIACIECGHGEPDDDCTCATCFCNPENVDEPADAEAVSA